VASSPSYSFSEAIKLHFGIPLAKHEAMRSDVGYLLKAMAKAGVITLDGEQLAHKTSWRIPAKEMLAVRNAVLLQGIFPEPKVVIKLFNSVTERRSHAQWARELLLERQSVAGLALVHNDLIDFLRVLESQADLKTHELANPYPDALPQIGLANYGGNLLRALATQTAALSVGDNMMLHYLNGELEQAVACANSLITDNALLRQYRSLIIREYEQAKEFDDLLDFLR
jgi:hypothetical protein